MGKKMIRERKQDEYNPSIFGWMVGWAYLDAVIEGVLTSWYKSLSAAVSISRSIIIVSSPICSIKMLPYKMAIIYTSIYTYKHGMGICCKLYYSIYFVQSQTTMVNMCHHDDNEVYIYWSYKIWQICTMAKGKKKSYRLRSHNRCNQNTHMLPKCVSNQIRTFYS